MTIGSAIIGLLGLFHLAYTFQSDKFWPRDRELAARLEDTAPVISAETTMWRAWIGFNASHSLGALLFSAVYGYLAAFELWFLLSSPFLMAVSVLTLACYLILARRYWFKVPFAGIAVALVLFIGGYLIAYV